MSSSNLHKRTISLRAIALSALVALLLPFSPESGGAQTKGQSAYEYAEKKQGYFTWTLIEALRGRAANERGEWTLAGLLGYLEKQTPVYVRRDLVDISGIFSDRVIRGGGLGNAAGRCRSADRRYDLPGYRDGYLGFRLVRVGR